MAALHDGDPFRHMAVDACHDAVTRDACASMRGLRAMGYEYTIRYGAQLTWLMSCSSWMLQQESVDMYLKKRPYSKFHPFHLCSELC